MRKSRFWVAVACAAAATTVIAACGSSSPAAAPAPSTSTSSGSTTSSGPASSGPASSSGAAPSSSAGTVGAVPTGKVTITFMEAMSSGTLKTALTTLTANFEKAYPNITVQLVAEPDYGTLQAKEQAAIAAGNPPTIAQVYESWADTYSAAGAIVPLASFVDGANGISKADQDQIWSGVMKDQYLPDGKLWMWPFNKSDYIMYYNKTMLDADHLSVPTTWAQYASDAAAVTKDGQWMLSMDTGTATAPQNGTYLYVSILRSYGGELISNGKPTFDSPQAQQALTYLAGLVKPGYVKLGTNYPGQTALGAGKTLTDMSTVASYYYNQQAVGNKFTMDAAAFPDGPAGHGNVMAGTNIAIFSKASSEQQAAGWAFMKWLTEPAQQAYWAETSGYLPVTQAALPLMTSFLASHPYQKIAADELAWAAGTPPYSWYTQAVGALDDALAAALGGHESVQAALSAAQSKAESYASAAS